MKTAKDLLIFKRQMKRKPTESEKWAKTILESRGIEFKNQMILGFYILDFVIPERMLVIEIDGEYHKGREGYDFQRDDFIRECGFSILRVKNENVSREIPYLIYGFDVIDDWNKVFRSALGKANSLKGKYINEKRKNRGSRNNPYKNKKKNKKPAKDRSR